eukprot:2367136-Rhodomonas_salina.1
MDEEVQTKESSAARRAEEEKGIAERAQRREEGRAAQGADRLLLELRVRAQLLPEVGEEVVGRAPNRLLKPTKSEESMPEQFMA